MMFAQVEQQRAQRVEAEETASVAEIKRQQVAGALQQEKDDALRLRAHNNELKAALAEM